jgi:hypothetical protein
MNRNTSGLVALCGAVALIAGCNDSDSDGLPVLSGPQTGSVSVNLASAGVTFPTQPQGIDLSGTAVYDDPTDTVTLSLTVRDGSKTILQNPKVIPTNLSEGTITGDGTFGLPGPADGGSDPYIYYGPEEILPKESVTRDIVINGVTGAVADITMDVEIVMHPYWILSPGYDEIGVVDSSGSGQETTVDIEALGFLGQPPIKKPDGGVRDTRFLPFASTADGRYVYFSCWNQPAVGKLDLSDLTASFGPSLAALPLAFDGTGPVGSVDSLTLSPDEKYVYAVLNDGCHSLRNNQTYPGPDVKVYKLNASNLSIVDSVELFPSTVIPPPTDGGLTYLEYRGRRLSISDDGTMGALAVTDLGTVYLLDLNGLTVVDQDDVTAGDQGFDVSATSITPRHAAISGDASTIYVAYSGNDGTLDVIDVATGGITTLAPLTLSTNNNVGFLEFGPDGRLYYGRNFDALVPGVSIYDPVGDAWVELTDIASAEGISFGETSYCVADQDDDTIQCFAYADDTTVPVEATALDTLTAPVDNGHGLVLTDI